MSTPKVRLEVTDLQVGFGGAPVLNDASLTVPDRGFVGLVGPNGAGKTTLINCVSGLVPALAGSVRCDGKDVLALPPHGRAELGIGRTFQQAQLLDGLTCLDNVLVGSYAWAPSFGVFGAARARRREAVDVARQALVDVGLDDVRDRAVADLPFGVRRRVDLARSLAMRPNLILLDEPLSGLSGSERGAMAELLASLPERGMAVLMVEHDVAYVRRLCSTVVVLDYGVVLANGPTDVLDLPEVAEAYLGIAPTT